MQAHATLPPLRGRVQRDAPLGAATWFRVGGPAEVLVPDGLALPLLDALAYAQRRLADWQFDAETGTRWHWTVKGASVSGLNPKQLLLLLALLPQFVRPGDSWPVFAQIMVLGAVHAASCAVVYFGVGWGSQSVLRSRPAAALAVSRLSGTLMLLIAAVLLGEIAVQHL